MNKSDSKYFNTATKMDLALITLLNQKPLEYITICEICKTAGVNRSTFYLHYETIGDLLNETTQYLLNDFLSYFPNNTLTVSDHITECSLDQLVLVCDEYLTPYFTYIKDNQKIFKTALQHISLLGLEDIYVRLFDVIFNPILERFHYPSEIRNYVMKYYLNGLNAIVNEWLKDNCQKSIHELIEIVTVCIFGLQEKTPL